MNRTYWVAGAVLIAVAALGYWFFFLRSGPITNYPSSGTDIIAFGDSLIAGQGATSGHDFVSILSQDIGQPIVNLGVAGNTTADGLARLNQLDQYHPKVVILLLGGNDYLQHDDIDTTFTNLASIIQNIQSRGAVVLLLGVRGGVLDDHFASRYEDLAKTYHTAYVSDVLSGLLGHQDLMSDEVHPNDAGYALIANRIEPVLKPLLQ